MRTLAEQMATDAAAVFLNTDEHAESVTYETPGGSQSTFSAVVDRQPVQEETSNGGRFSRMTARVTTSRVNVPSPSLRDSWIFDGETWTVDQVLSVDSAMVSVAVASRHAIEISKRDYRGR